MLMGIETRSTDGGSIVFGAIGRGEQFCTDVVGGQAHGEQRLGACHHRRYCPSERYSMFLAPAADGSPSGVPFHVAKLGVTPAWAPACEWPPGWATVVPRHLTRAGH